MNLASRVLGFAELEELLTKLQEHSIGTDEIDELRSRLAYRRRKHESDEDYETRIRAADLLITAWGKMAWKPGERDSEDTDIRGDSLSAGMPRDTTRSDRWKPAETESGDEFGDERD